ncbi:MAG TPA: hypothetical protein VK897_18835 [Anaerolineales bacterium]|nr:hypothetical protein [Anaerolineales bacterium]
MTTKPLDIAGFLRLVIDALNAAKVEYLIGGVIAEWAWGEPRATQDLDLVVKIPIKSVNKLSKELEEKDMLIPAEIILDTILEDRADIPINAIHMHSGLKADRYPVREGDELRQSAFERREQVDYGPPIGKVYIHSPEDLILYKLMYFGLSQQSKHSRDIAAILKSKKEELDTSYIEQWADRLGLSSVWKEMLYNFFRDPVRWIRNVEHQKVVLLTYSEFNFRPNRAPF